MKLILATHNLHKRQELVDVLTSQLGGAIEVLTLDEVSPQVGEIVETGSTLEENALIKAHAVFALTGIPSLADDTGLEVSALSGAPGVYSARYAGEGATYDDNVNKLLTALNGVTVRSARFATVIAFVDGEGTDRVFRGEVEGSISLARRGSNGFGYDPIFVPGDDAEGPTFAEMSADEKNAISHRGRALRKFADYLKNLQRR